MHKVAPVHKSVKWLCEEKQHPLSMMASNSLFEQTVLHRGVHLGVTRRDLLTQLVHALWLSPTHTPIPRHPHTQFPKPLCSHLVIPNWHKPHTACGGAMDAPVAGCGGYQEDPDLAGNDANFTDNENDGAQEEEDADIDKVDDMYVDIDNVCSDNDGTAACREDDAASFVDDNFDHNIDDNPGNEAGNNTEGDIGNRASNDCTGIDEVKDDNTDHSDIDQEGNNVSNIATNHTACRDDCHGRHAKRARMSAVSSQATLPQRRPPLPKPLPPKPSQSVHTPTSQPPLGQQPRQTASTALSMTDLTMESPMVDVLETCRRIYSEHAAIVNANNYHWERVWNMMNYLADRLKLANRR